MYIIMLFYGVSDGLSSAQIRDMKIWSYQKTFGWINVAHIYLLLDKVFVFISYSIKSNEVEIHKEEASTEQSDIVPSVDKSA